MLNIIKADWYRLRHHKGLYITLILLILFLGLQGMGARGQIGVVTETANQETSTLEPTGAMMPMVILGSIDNQIYFLLAFIVFIAGADFSSHTVKNAISSGVSRLDYFLSKLFLSALFALIIVLLSGVIPTIMATVKNGFGDPFPNGQWLVLLKAYGLVFYMYMALTVFGVMLAFVSKKIASLNGLYLIFCLVPSILIMILSMIDAVFLKMFKFEFISNMRSIANIVSFTPEDYMRIVLIGGTLMVLSLAITYVFYSKCDIK